MLTAIRHKALLILGCLLLAVVLGACGGSNEVEIEARARVMAKAMVEATVQAA